MRPVTAPCGHSFCMQHLQEWITEQRKRGIAEPVCTFRCLLLLPRLEDLCVNHALADAVALVAAHRTVAASPPAMSRQAFSALFLILVGWVATAWGRVRQSGAVTMTVLYTVCQAAEGGAAHFWAGIAHIQDGGTYFYSTVAGAVFSLIVNFRSILRLCYLAASVACARERQSRHAAVVKKVPQRVAARTVPWYRRTTSSWCYGMLGAALVVVLMLMPMCLYIGYSSPLPLDDPELDRLLPLHPLVGADRDRLIYLCDAALRGRHANMQTVPHSKTHRSLAFFIR